MWWSGCVSVPALCRGAGGCSRRSGPRFRVRGWPALRGCDRSPAGVLTCHVHHQLFDLRFDWRSSRRSALFDPSNLWATSLRYHARIVSGLDTQAICRRAFRLSRLPISASVDLCASNSRTLFGSCARRMRSSAIRYSFCSSRSWLTNPVTYASSRAHLLSCILPVHDKSSCDFNGIRVFWPCGVGGENGWLYANSE
jgi:hypothetical protein